LRLRSAEFFDREFEERRVVAARTVARLNSSQAEDFRPLTREWAAKIRDFASDRLDREVFNSVRPYASSICLDQDDLLVLAALLREATRRFGEYLSKGKPDEEMDDLVEGVATVLENAKLPLTISGGPAFRAYYEASIDWYKALSETPHLDRFWAVVETLVQADMSAQPDTRERLIKIIADIGRRQTLPPALSKAVLEFARRPFLFSNPANFLHILGYDLHVRILEADLEALTEHWLGEWRAHMAVSRGWWNKGHRTSLVALRNDIHTRIGMMLSIFGIIFGRLGGTHTTLTFLLIKIDYLVFINPKRQENLIGLLWLAWMRSMFRWLDTSARKKRRKRIKAIGPWALHVPLRRERHKLRIITDDTVSGTRRDLLVTRAQGGIGDIMTMRPGLIGAARRRPWGRVVFATNRAYFAVFSVDDPVDLVDLERTQIDALSFGKWVNFSVYPEAAVERREIPRVKSNRIDIYARAMGVKFRPFSHGRVRPIRFAPEIDAAAESFLRGHGGTGIRVGVQLRSAESYRDVPALLHAARQLAKRNTVFIFDSFPISRAPDDGIIAVDSQPLPVAMAIASKLDYIIAPDSFFVHLAGSNGIPCLALFGPTDGGVRCRPYPTVRYIDARTLLTCLPCWRNEILKCRLAQSFDSACMHAIKSDMIVDAFDQLVEATRSRWWRLTPRRRIDAVYAESETNVVLNTSAVRAGS
jgi:hypothetical protein